MKIDSIAKTTSIFIRKNSSTILTGMAVAGVFGTAVMAVKATPKALRLMELEKESKKKDILTKKEVIKTTWTCYMPAGVMGLATAMCIVGANNINLRRNAALASAYTLTESALKEYQKEVVAEVGEKKEEVIRDNVAKKKIEENPVGNNEVIVTGKGETLCYEDYTGRYFKSDIDKVKNAFTRLNERLINEGDIVSLNDVFYELGLGTTTMGDELGWDGTDGIIQVKYSSILNEEGVPCLCISYGLRPKTDYM